MGLFDFVKGIGKKNCANSGPAGVNELRQHRQQKHRALGVERVPVGVQVDRPADRVA